MHKLRRRRRRNNAKRRKGGFFPGLLSLMGGNIRYSKRRGGCSCPSTLYNMIKNQQPLTTPDFNPSYWNTKTASGVAGPLPGLY